MSTEAMTKGRQTADDPPTLDDVRRKDERRQELIERRGELEDREAELSQEIADRTAAGEEVSELSEKRQQVRQRKEDVGLAVDALADRVETGRERAAAREAEERLATIKRKCGGIAGEHPRRLERLEAAVEAAEKEVEALNAAHARQQTYRQEARALADRFELDVPDMKTVLPPARAAEASDLMERLSVLRLSGAIRGPRDQKTPAERARQAADRLESEHGEDSPAPELFAFAGELGEEAWEEERERRSDARRRQMDREREEHREAVDTWLEEKLRHGPVPRGTVVDAAREELAEQVKALGGSGLSSVLSKARERLDVRTLAHDQRPGTYWGLSDTDTGEGSPWGVPSDNRPGRVA